MVCLIPLCECGIIFEIRGGATSGYARFVERHGDLLCPDGASNYLKAQKKRWDKMEKVVVSERHKMSSDEFLNIVMVHARSFFPDEYKEWEKHSTRMDDRRYNFVTFRLFIRNKEARNELHPPDKESKASQERLRVHNTRMSATKYGWIGQQSGSGCINIARPTLGVFASLDRF
jgi:hypothetical protein